MPALLNPKHERFCQERASGKNAVDAYEIANGTKNRRYASALGQRDDISRRIAELLDIRDKMAAKSTEKAAEALAVDKQWVMARLKENALRALQAVPATDENGEPIGEYGYNGTVANRALELLGKEIGMFIDRKDITHRDGDLERLTDAELLARLTREAADLGIAGPAAEEGETRH